MVRRTKHEFYSFRTPLLQLLCHVPLSCARQRANLIIHRKTNSFLKKIKTLKLLYSLTKTLTCLNNLVKSLTMKRNLFITIFWTTHFSSYLAIKTLEYNKKTEQREKREGKFQLPFPFLRTFSEY